MTQAKIDLIDSTTVRLSDPDVDGWGDFTILRKDEPEDFDLISKYHGKFVSIAGTGEASACGYALYNLHTIAGICEIEGAEESLGQTKNNSLFPISFLQCLIIIGIGSLLWLRNNKLIIFCAVTSCILLGYQASSGIQTNSTWMCRICGQVEETNLLHKLTGQLKSYSRFGPQKTESSNCKHDWVQVQVVSSPLDRGWFKSNSKLTQSGPIIFNSEADFYYTAFFTAANSKLGSYQFTDELGKGILSALNAKDACSKELLAKHRSFILDASLPVEDRKDSDACKALEQLLKKHGHL